MAHAPKVLIINHMASTDYLACGSDKQRQSYQVTFQELPDYFPEAVKGPSILFLRPVSHFSAQRDHLKNCVKEKGKCDLVDDGKKEEWV